MFSAVRIIFRHVKSIKDGKVAERKRKPRESLFEVERVQVREKPSDGEDTPATELNPTSVVSFAEQQYCYASYECFLPGSHTLRQGSAFTCSALAERIPNLFCPTSHVTRGHDG